MGGNNRNETFVLKHRLTGAAILIAFAVIILPMLLGGPADEGTPDGGETGDVVDDQVFHSKIQPIGGEVPSPAERGNEQNAAKRPESPPSDDNERQNVISAIDEGNEQEATGDTDVKEPAEGGSEPEAPVGSEPTIERGWIVQVGTFKNPDNVKKLVAKLKSGGLIASTTEVDTSEGMATRVWIGPFETRVEAARHKTRVKQRTGTEGLIVAYP